MKCELCMAKSLWQEKGFYGLICKKCKVPMIILIEHRDILTKDEIKTVEKLRLKHHPCLKYRGWGMRTIPQHWHEHLIKKEKE